MTSCTNYNWTAGNPIFRPLIAKIKKDGVPEKELDAGYYQIDYSKPMGPGYFKAAGDCTISEPEALEYATRNWKKYRDELRDISGRSLFWDLSPDAVKKTDVEYKELAAKNSKLSKEISDVIAIIKQELAKRNVPEDSDEYKTRMADGIFLWYQFPIKPLRGELAVKKDELLKELPQLSDPYWNDLGKYLFMNGGQGALSARFVPPSRPSELSSNVPFFSIAGAGVLYHALEQAGMSPMFFENIPFDQQLFRCALYTFITYGCGIKLSGHWKIMEPSTDPASTTKFTVSYPLSLRQAYLANLLQDEYMDILISRSDENTKVMTANDGTAGFYKHLISLMLTGPDSEEKDSLMNFFTENELVDKKGVMNGKNWHPAYLPLMMFFTSKKSDLFPDPPSFQKNIYVLMSSLKLPSYIINFSKILASLASKEENLSDKGLVTSAKKLLTLDPECLFAHSLLAKHGAEVDASIDPDPHFERLSILLGKNEKSYIASINQWGKYKLSKKQIDAAKTTFLKGTQYSGPVNASIVKTYLHLASIYFHEGNLPDARKAISKADELLLELAPKLDKTDVDDIADLIAKWKNSGIYDPEMLKDEAIAKTYTDIHIKAATILMYHRRPKEALAIAGELINEPRLAKMIGNLETLSFLHEIHTQANDPKGAEKILQQIETNAFGEKQSE